MAKKILFKTGGLSGSIPDGYQAIGLINGELSIAQSLTQSMPVLDNSIEYVVSFPGFDEVVTLESSDYTIENITLSSNISGVQISIDGGQLVTPNTPLSITSGMELLWKATFSGTEMGAINIKGKK